MKRRHGAIGIVAVGAMAWVGLVPADRSVAEPLRGKLAPQPSDAGIARRLGSMLPRYHVLQQPFDDEISRRAWTNLITFYDFDHSVFLQSDLDRWAVRQTALDDEIRAGDVTFGYEVYRTYVERLNERIDFATNLLARGAFDFTANEDYRIRRKDAPWPATREDAEEHWRKRMKNEVLAMTLAKRLEAEDAKRKGSAQATRETKPGEGTAPDGKREERPEEALIKKYRQYYTVLTEPDEEAVLQHYLSAVARAFDPHTDYMSPTKKEEFDMDMNLTLCGVGAVLSMDDGALKISEIMSGGPIDRDGRIKEGDKIVGVRQGDGEIEDIMWQPMKKSIKKIRGPKGTRVTLQIVPRSDPSGATRKLIDLVRDEIRLEDQAATGHVERVALNGVTNRIGYVYLPGFYGTMGRRPSDPQYRSCANDVNRYLVEFNESGAEALVLDLRGNGGGSLLEAVRMSALFVPEGPVVQIRDTNRVGCLPIPSDGHVAFRKPIVVLTDRASASASEIVAGHLQDTGRAIVLGDGRTHGKGTVQTVMGMGPERNGSMKITTARFYRVDGRSTQVEGVAADIRLPSLLDSLDIGEDKLPNALPFSRIRSAYFTRCWDLMKYVPQLRELSQARLKDDARYRKHLENVTGMKEISERVSVPLEEKARLAMMRADRELREVDEENDEEKKPVRRRRQRQATNDVVLDEAFRVAADLVRLNGGRELQEPVRHGIFDSLFEDD